MGTPFLQNLRMQNLFPIDDQFLNLKTGAGTFSGQPVIPDRGPDISQVQIGQPEPPIFKPETRAQDALYGMMQQFPERNKPGMLRKIAASMASVGRGPEAANYFLHAPYIQEMEDFNARLKPMSDVATQERMSNNQLRQIASDAMRNDAAQRRLDIQFEDLQRKDRNDKSAQAVRDRRAATYDWKARNPNMEIETDKDGRLIGINPQTGAVHYITGPDGQSIKSNELSAEDKANLQIRVARERARITGDQQIRVEGVRQQNREKLVNLRAEKRQKAKETEKISVTQDAAAWKLARQQFLADNPHYSHLWDTEGNPNIGDSDDEDDYVEAVNQVRERYNTIKSRAGGRTTPPGPVNKPPQALPPSPQAGRVIVEKDGKQYSLPANQLQQAKSQGYKEVK